MSRSTQSKKKKYFSFSIKGTIFGGGGMHVIMAKYLAAENNVQLLCIVIIAIIRRTTMARSNLHHVHRHNRLNGMSCFSYYYVAHFPQIFGRSVIELFCHPCAFSCRGDQFREDIHRGVYRCRAQNRLGTIISRLVRLNAG